jgi:regulator of protease activity HflC (stomatin/prohibitin superfamily)
VDDFVRGDIDNEAIMACAQRTLDQLRSGILMTSVSQRECTVPPRVLLDFQAVNKAQSEKALSIETAERFRAEVLNEAAGGGHRVLLAAIDDYERTRNHGMPATLRAAEHRVSELLVSAEVGGRVAEMISEARTYRTEVVEYVRGAAGRFNRLVDQHDENPRIIRDRMRQGTVEHVLRGDCETFHLPQGEKVIYLETSRKTRGK